MELRISIFDERGEIVRPVSRQADSQKSQIRPNYFWTFLFFHFGGTFEQEGDAESSQETEMEKDP